MGSKSKKVGLALVCIVGAALAACSSSDSKPAVISPVGKPCTQPADCTGGTYCAGSAATGSSVCVSYTGPGGNPTGQADAPCDPAGGLDNPDCDGAHGFKCLAASPTDASAVCALYDCTKDTDCGPNRYCATLNAAPSASNAAKDPGKTIRVCQQTSYCSSCVVDLDCAPRGARKGKCTTDEAGKNFCSYACSTDTECPQDARCAQFSDGSSACMPNAGTCIGDGNLCSPCRSDADCKNGECLRAYYSTERFCSQRVASCSGACKREMVTTKALPAEASLGCTAEPDSVIPPLQCSGLTQLGSDQKGDPIMLPGCWTRPRAD